MQFVAKAVGPTGHERWLTEPKRHGLRAFGPRELAEIFATQEAAHAAIAAMLLNEQCDGLMFVAEAAHLPDLDRPPFEGKNETPQRPASGARCTPRRVTGDCLDIRAESTQTARRSLISDERSWIAFLLALSRNRF
jgi:hypothetical protein